MSWAELVAAAEGIRADARLERLRVVAVGWATVEADRAFDELDVLLGAPSGWVPQARDELLGASVWQRDPSPGGDVDGIHLLVLEPDTEWRLAANLARFGEGVGAVYLAAPNEVADRVAAVNPRWGPFAIVRSSAG